MIHPVLDDYFPSNVFVIFYIQLFNFSDHVIQIQHVLNGCKSFKTQERYLWRHLAVLDYLGTLLEKNIEQDGKHWAAFRCYLDVPGRRTHDDGTVPDQLLQTELKPDIFILDQRDHLER